MAAAAAGESKIGILFKDIHVRWSMGQEEQKEAIFSFKGMENAFDALHQSWDKDKWKTEEGKDNLPTLLLFDFSTIHNDEKGFYEFESRFGHKVLKHINNEKKQEDTMHTIAREAGYKGWASKFYSSDIFPEYVVFSEYITPDMRLDTETYVRKYVVNQIDWLNDQERYWTTVFDKNITSIPPLWTQISTKLSTQGSPTLFRVALEYLFTGKDLPPYAIAAIGYDQVEKLLLFVNNAMHTTSSVRIMSKIVPDIDYTIFDKYKVEVDIENMYGPIFKRFGSTFLKYKIPTLRL